MTMYLAGLGTAQPPYRFSQAEAAEIARTFYFESATLDRLLPTLYRRAGVESRGSVLLDTPAGEIGDRQSFYPPSLEREDGGPTTATRMARYAADAPPLALAAAQLAWRNSGMTPDAATHLITVSCTGFMAPGVDRTLIVDGGLNPNIARTHVGYMGCHGALNALRVAQAFVEADPAACVLLCAVELCTLHYHYGDDPEQAVANSLFADGAAAVICTGRPPPVARPGGWRLQATGAGLFADTAEAMTWTIGNHGFAMTLSRQVPPLIERELGGWIRPWLARHDLRLEDVQTWAVHPGGPKILQATELALGLGEGALDVSRQILSECGNMSSPTVLFVLERLAALEAPGPCVALGFGPGLAVEAALLVH